MNYDKTPSSASLDAAKLAELKELREENAHLKALLNRHGIAWEKTPAASHESQTISLGLVDAQNSTAEKVTLFRSLFRGRGDVYPLRWESAKGKSGYSPACGNEWKAGICNKPQVKCSKCTQRLLLPVTDQVVYDHLAGVHTIGVYPLMADDTCYFLAVDFDGAEWKDDVRSFMQSCMDLSIPAALEISRSGNGGHVWIFFGEPVSAREARHLGASLISHTCDLTRQLSLTSYDRFFPNQDTLPKGGFGNLIALPLQKKPRELGRSVFVDNNFVPFSDQWMFLSSIKPLSRAELENAVLRASGGKHPLDVTFETEEDDIKPWRRQGPMSNQINGPLPESLTLVLANQVFLSKNDLPQSLTNRLIRLAAFQNPEFYKAQAMRLPVWNKPRLIGCAENFISYIGMPRGRLDAVLDLLNHNNIQVELQDERVSGCKLIIRFIGTLKKEQKTAVRKMIKQEVGVLCAPTAFGKTVVAAAIIARRKVSTLILVHRTELLRQWRERLTSFLDMPKGGLGVIHGGKNKPNRKLDVAVMQSLSRRKDLSELLDSYGQIIVDECHHISAFSFEAILKQAKARFVVGLTATPVRRDGLHPIIFMQCGPIRHNAPQLDTAPTQLEVWPQFLTAPDIPTDSAIHDVFRILVNDSDRNGCIAKNILAAYMEGRKILVLTERTGHLELLRESLGDQIDHCFVLHGSLSKKQRAEVFNELDSMEDTAPRIILATGRLIGEGFDHPPLDTLVLAMPISWKGTLQQYAGRLHREHAEKSDVRIYDYVETDQPQLSRMWGKRLRGYRAMGYQIRNTD